MTGADLLVSSLFTAGVRTIFGMPGSHTVAIYDAIHRHGGIRTILMRNEQAGAFAADGYARVSSANLASFARPPAPARPTR